MKAAFIERFGGPEVLQYGDLPDPVAGPGEVVIDVAATSVNAADWKVRLGEYKHTKFPLVPGRDFSGTVSAVGEGVKDIALGDMVFGVCEAGRRAPTRKRLPSRRESSPRSRADCRMSTPPLWRSLASRL